MKHLLFCSKFSNSKYFDSVSPCNSPMKQVLTITVLLETGEEGLQAPVWANTGLLPERAAASHLERRPAQVTQSHVSVYGPARLAKHSFWARPVPLNLSSAN